MCGAKAFYDKTKKGILARQCTAENGMWRRIECVGKVRKVILCGGCDLGDGGIEWRAEDSETVSNNSWGWRGRN